MTDKKRKRSKIYGYRPPKHRVAELERLLEHISFGQLCEEHLYGQTRKNKAATHQRALILKELGDLKEAMRQHPAENADVHSAIVQRLSELCNWVFADGGRRK